MNFTKDKIDLDKIRSELVRLEDSIIFALIERAQFSLNQSIYIPNHPNFQFDDNFKGTFLGYFLHLIESAHAKVRRYTSPDEYPFTANLPAPILPPITFPKLLIPNTINKNAKLLEIYTSSIVPLISIPGDDLNYGSAATKDVEVLQLISRRIHFGKLVAEAKFNDARWHDKYVDLIKKKDRKGIEDLLTNKQVEEKLLQRLKRKADVYGREIDDQSHVIEIDEKIRLPVNAVVSMYENHIIPLTKEVEIEYLLIRLDYPDFIPEGQDHHFH